jgi:hypothetical protein
MSPTRIPLEKEKYIVYDVEQNRIAVRREMLHNNATDTRTLKVVPNTTTPVPIIQMRRFSGVRFLAQDKNDFILTI